MYAVLKTGGKQYKVTDGDRIKVEKLPAEAGDQVKLDQVLMIVDGDSVRVGKPFLDNASVDAIVVEHGKGRKVTVMKKKRRQGYKVKRGHRQPYTMIEIKCIQA